MDKKSWIDLHENKIQLVSRKIWEYAETGLLETKSSWLLQETLKDCGFHIETGFSGMETAFCARWGSGKPVIGFLGEFDALPMLSQKAVPYRTPLKEDAAGHGCGHNLLGTAAMSAAIDLKEYMEQEGLEGTVVFWGCPDEEASQGKIFIARDGYFNELDVALTMHPGIANYANEASSAAFYSAEFSFFGRASHAAAAPENGRSALDAVELMHVAVNYLREHVGRDVSMHYVTVRGGEKPNIVPEFAKSWIIVRGPDIGQVKRVYERIEKIAKGACLMTETTYESQIKSATYHFNVNETLVQEAYEAMKQVGGIFWTEEELAFAKEISSEITTDEKRSSIENYTTTAGIKMLENKWLHDGILPPLGRSFYSSGSTDVSDVSWIVPTLEVITACRPVGVSAHTWQQTACGGMSIGEKGMFLAARTLSSMGRRLVTDSKLLDRVKAEFLETTGGRSYEPIIGADCQPGLTS